MGIVKNININIIIVGEKKFKICKNINFRAFLHYRVRGSYFIYLEQVSKNAYTPYWYKI